MATVAVRRTTRTRGRTPLLWLIAVSAAALVGAASESKPTLIMLSVAALTLATVAFRLTSVVLVAALLTLGYLPESLLGGGFFANPELQKGFLFLAVGLLVVTRGVRPKFLLPVVGYMALAALSAAHGVMPGLSVNQVASSFVTLTLAWALLSVKWEPERDLKYLKVIALVPLFSVALGVLLHVGGLHPLWDSSEGAAFPRLRGASIPAQLGLSSFVGCFAAYVWTRLEKSSLAVALMAANGAILLLTLTRGPAIALGIALLWPALRFGLGAFRSRPQVGVLRLLAVMVAIGAAALTFVPALETRQSGQFSYAGAPSIERDASSGRKQAWSETYEIAKQSPLFGHGLGAGPITEVEQGGFKAQHNEYLRLFLEGGYIGGGLVLLSIILAVGWAIAAAPRRLRLDLVGLSLGVAFLSATDNTLNSPSHAVAFCVVLGLCASLGRRQPAGLRVPPPVAPPPPPQTPSAARGPAVPAAV